MWKDAYQVTKYVGVLKCNDNQLTQINVDVLKCNDNQVPNM